MSDPVPRLRSSKEARKLIDSYFKTAAANSSAQTLTGLMLHCGFVSRQSYYDYLKHDTAIASEFRRAHLLIEGHYENLLQRPGNNGGCIFALKNMNWSDSRQVDVTSQGEKVVADPISIVFEEVQKDVA